MLPRFEKARVKYMCETEVGRRDHKKCQKKSQKNARKNNQKKVQKKY